MILKTKPWRHQLEAIEFMKGKPSGLFAVGLGCGKSLITIGAVTDQHEAPESILIVCPLAVCLAWELQFKLHCGVPYKITILNKGAVRAKLKKVQRDREAAQFAGVMHVMVINYDSYWREPIGTWFLRKRVDMVVADECFTGDVLVEGITHQIPIKELKIGDAVWGYESANKPNEVGKVVKAKVLHVFENPAPEKMLAYPGGAVTRNHPIFTFKIFGPNVHEKYVEAYRCGGRFGKSFKHNEPRRIPEMFNAAGGGRGYDVVYNIETTTGNYFAGDYLVHNCHRLKSPGGKASRFAARLGKTCGVRLGLSGTPLAHSPMDAYGLFRFLDPKIFGTSFARFRNKYAVMGGFEGREVIGYREEEDFNERFHSITFTRDRSVITLPEETHVTIPIDLPQNIMNFYKELELEFVAEVEDGVVSVQNALTKLLRLQQITSGHIIKDDEERPTVLHNEKAKALQTIMEDLDKDEPLVVFCRFRADLNAVHAAATACHRDSLELSGTRKELEQWQSGAATVIAVQIQSGSEGITLVRSCYAVYFSIGFSLSQYEQSLARICRPGQERPCTYFHLVCRGTVDQKVYRALKQRKKVIEHILREIKQ